MVAGIEKRIQSLEQRVGYRRARTIVIQIPTRLTPVEGSVDCASTVMPEARAAVDEMLRAVGVTDEDTVIEIARFYQATQTNGKSELQPTPSPELLSVT